MLESAAIQVKHGCPLSVHSNQCCKLQYMLRAFQMCVILILARNDKNCVSVQPNIASVYNLNNNSYRRFPMYDDPFCNGHLQLINGQILIVGGDNVHQLAGLSDGRFNVRVFTGGAQPSYRIAAVMPPNPFPNPDPNSGGRWYPSLATMVDGNVLIVGGQSTEGTHFCHASVLLLLIYATYFRINYVFTLSRREDSTCCLAEMGFDSYQAFCGTQLQTSQSCSLVPRVRTCTITGFVQVIISLQKSLAIRARTPGWALVNCYM